MYEDASDIAFILVAYLGTVITVLANTNGRYLRRTRCKHYIHVLWAILMLTSKCRSVIFRLSYEPFFGKSGLTHHTMTSFNAPEEKAI